MVPSGGRCCSNRHAQQFGRSAISCKLPAAPAITQCTLRQERRLIVGQGSGTARGVGEPGASSAVGAAAAASASTAAKASRERRAIKKQPSEQRDAAGDSGARPSTSGRAAVAVAARGDPPTDAGLAVLTTAPRELLRVLRADKSPQKTLQACQMVASKKLGLGLYSVADLVELCGLLGERCPELGRRCPVAAAAREAGGTMFEFLTGTPSKEAVRKFLPASRREAMPEELVGQLPRLLLAMAALGYKEQVCGGGLG